MGDNTRRVTGAQHDASESSHFYSCGTNGYVVKVESFAGLIHCTGDLCRS